MDYDLLLQDRIAKIQAINKQYDLEHNAYISFSGGKDSTILHYLIDIALPNNKIPRLFLNTGIEYKHIVEYVKELAKNDDRIIIYNSGVNIKDMLNKYGYPFKSKEHSFRVEQFNKGLYSNYIKKYISGYDHNGNKSTFVCPQILLYQFEKQGEYNYSNKCCYKLKKEPCKIWAKVNNKNIVITGMRAVEGGNRKRLGCIITDINGKLMKFHPLIVVDDDFENQFIKENNIKLCVLYYPPYNFKRTGCKGCPFSLNLQEQLDIMMYFLPNEYNQCEILWKPIYDEYRRINYRLKNNVNYQLTIFDFL